MIAANNWIISNLIWPIVIRFNKFFIMKNSIFVSIKAMCDLSPLYFRVCDHGKYDKRGRLTRCIHLTGSG